MVKCPNEPHASEIIPGLWLGDEHSSNDINFIKKYQIKNIIRILPGIPSVANINYLHIPWNDKDICNKNVNDIFTQSIDFIEQSLSSNNNILIHCKRGHHRSAIIVVLFMVERLNMDLHKVVNYIRNRRKCSLRRLSCMVKQYIKYHMAHHY